MHRLVFGLFDSAEVVCENSVSFAPFFLSIYVLSCPLLAVLSEAATKTRLREK